jgi:hypothetical protein
LEVLAERVVGISRVMQDTEKRTTEDAKKAACRVAKAVAGLADYERRMAEENTRFESEASGAEEGLHSLRNRMLAVFNEICELVSNVRESIAKMMEQAACLKQPVSRVRAVESVLRETARLTAGYGSPGKTMGSKQSAAEGLRRKYTMAIEHNVHQAVTGGNTASVSAGDLVPGDVELF